MNKRNRIKNVIFDKRKLTIQNLFILFLVLKLNLSSEEEYKEYIHNLTDDDILFDQTLYSNNYLNNDKNVIIGVIENYSLYTILPFFKSLISINFHNCDIVMFVRNVSHSLINYLKNIGVVIYKIPNIYRDIPIISVRWKMYIDFLKAKKNEYKLVFSADIRDTFFQKDVFKYYENHEPFLGVAIEDGTLDEECNKNWILDFVGEKIHKILKNERIICVGTIWGTLDKFLEFSKIFWEKLSAFPKSIEQGIANYLFYYEKIAKDSLVKSDNYGPIMTIGLTDSKNIILDNNNNILNFKGEIASVIHQYDRHYDLMIKITNKYCPELLILDEIKSKFNILRFRQLLQLLLIILLLKVITKKMKR